jgi:hypothetical protein
MKFDKFIKSKFVYLKESNTDPNNVEVAQPEMPSASNVDEVGSEMAKNVEQAEKGLADVAKDLVELFRQILQTKDEQKRHTKLAELERACSGTGEEVLQNIEDFRDTNFSDAVRKDPNMPSLS